MKTKRHLLSVILAVVTVMGCEDSVGPAIGGGVIDAEDVSFNAELTVDTPMVFNEGHLVVTLTTNRQQIIIASIFSEFNDKEARKAIIVSPIPFTLLFFVPFAIVGTVSK